MFFFMSRRWADPLMTPEVDLRAEMEGRKLVPCSINMEGLNFQGRDVCLILYWGRWCGCEA